MCDTFVALPNATLDGSLIFGKNSDREPNEAHELMILPHAYHAEGEMVDCTYIAIPQVDETNAVLLAKPFWIWGCEMGANEHGVVIGNEAVFTKEPYGKKRGLIGMDFIRLALERANTAHAALKVITSLLEKYGQGGNCGFTHSLYYHNSFIIADAKEAWVLETSGKHWAAEKVKDVRSISNAITIGATWDEASADLVDYAIAQKWCKSADDFDFSRCYSDFIFTRFSDAHHRQCRTTQILKAALGKITPQLAFSILRDHGEAGADYQPGKGLHGAEVCCHAAAGPIRVSQSVGSMVTHTVNGISTHWLTGTSAPCTGVFKPVWLDAGLPAMGSAPIADYAADSLWWQHENLHRMMLRNFSLSLPLIQPEQQALEAQFLRDASLVAGKDAKIRLAFSQACFDQADNALKTWQVGLAAAEIIGNRGMLHQNFWRKLDKKAKRTSAS